MTTTKSLEVAREIVRSRGGVCLVPLPGKGGLSSHEKTFCDCEVEEMIALALDSASKLPKQGYTGSAQAPKVSEGDVGDERRAREIAVWLLPEYPKDADIATRTSYLSASAKLEGRLRQAFAEIREETLPAYDKQGSVAGYWRDRALKAESQPKPLSESEMPEMCVEMPSKKDLYKWADSYQTEGIPCDPSIYDALDWFKSRLKLRRVSEVREEMEEDYSKGVVKGFEAYDKLFPIHEELKDKYWKLGMAHNDERARSEKLALVAKKLIETPYSVDDAMTGDFLKYLAQALTEYEAGRDRG
jgi:hypothetical protein